MHSYLGHDREGSFCSRHVLFGGTNAAWRPVQPDALCEERYELEHAISLTIREHRVLDCSRPVSSQTSPGASPVLWTGHTNAGRQAPRGSPKRKCLTQKLPSRPCPKHRPIFPGISPETACGSRATPASVAHAAAMGAGTASREPTAGRRALCVNCTVRMAPR